MLNLNCVICAELFTHSDDVHVTTCGHMFHFTCLKQWLERSKSCPQCRNKCTDRNIFRVYFNLANLDVSRIDVGSLQEQLDNANLKIKIKEKDFKKSEEQIKILKETQKKCMKTIAALEQKLHKNDFIILNYSEQVKLLKADVGLVDDLRREVKALKYQIETMEGISSLLTASNSEAEKLLQTETDPKKLSVWVATLKRELRICENKKTDLRNLLKVVQNDLRKEIELKRDYEERISQLESENYQFNEKLKILESEKTTNNTVNSLSVNLDDSLLAPLKREHKRLTISPTIKDNIKKIEESNSPYLNIKSSSIGLIPLFKRNPDSQVAMETETKKTTVKLTTLKLSPMKILPNGSNSVGTIRKTSSDLSGKYSIFKKPRLGFDSSTTAAGNSSTLKPMGSNFVFNGFGGSEKADPFASSYGDNDEADALLRKLPSSSYVKAGSSGNKTNALSLSNRVKTGGLRNFKVNK